MQKRSSSVAENMQHISRVFHDTKIKELSHSFIQLEEQEFFIFWRMIKPTVHTIERGSLLEERHGTALAQQYRKWCTSW